VTAPFYVATSFSLGISVCSFTFLDLVYADSTAIFLSSAADAPAFLSTHTHNHFTALWTLSGTTRVSRYQKAHFAIFWIFWSKMKITQADAPTIWMGCHPVQTNWCPHLCHPQHFYAGCPSLHNPPNLSLLGTGTKYAGLHTRWLGGLHFFQVSVVRSR